MNNQEILDDEQLDNGKEVIDKRTQNLGLRVFIYLIFMLICNSGLVYYYLKNALLNQGFDEYITISIGVILFCIVLSIILEFFRFSIRKFKRKKQDVITLNDPFWFQIIEGAFAIWILFTVIKVIFIGLFGLI